MKKKGKSIIERSRALVSLNPRSFGFDLLDFETTLILILSLLGPEDMAKLDGTNHHIRDEDVCDDEKHSHDAANDLDWLAGESLSDCKRGSDECCVGKDEGIPGHGEDKAVISYDGEMGEYGYKEEEDCET